MSDYNVTTVREMYSSAYKKHGNSINSLFIPKGRQNERFDVLTTYIKQGDFSVLDYGCGLAHLKDYLDKRFVDFNYNGVDIVEEFVQENIKRHGNANFKRISHYSEVNNQYDFIISAGVFNLLYHETLEQQQTIVKDTLTHLFTKTNKVLSVDFMTDQVDFIQDRNYHQNVVEIYNFASNHLSRRLVIDQSYMPYEFTVHIFKDATVVRPDNLYKNL